MATRCQHIVKNLKPSGGFLRKLKCIGAIRDPKYINSGLKIVFFEEDEGTRLETVWEARNVPKLAVGVLYQYM